MNPGLCADRTHLIAAQRVGGAHKIRPGLYPERCSKPIWLGLTAWIRNMRPATRVRAAAKGEAG